MKRNKPVLILGIIVMLVGLGIILYPISNQEEGVCKQEQFMKEVKSEILKNIEELSVTGNNSGSSDFASNKAEITGNAADDNLQNYEAGLNNEENDGNVEADDDGNMESSDVMTVPGINNAPSFYGIEEQETVEEVSIYDNRRLRGQDCIGIIEIPSIDLIYVIVEGTDTENIGVAIGHFSNSVAIGEDGNCALAGHNGGTYGRYFGDIDELENGDEVKMINLLGEEYTYEVYDSFVVEPHETYVVKELDEPGKILTMVTCTNYGTQRLIVRARCTKEPEIIENTDEL